MELLHKYFTFTDEQAKKFEGLYPFYKEWNDKINLVSRKYFDAFYERHVLHSLAICKCFQFAPETSFVDVGTGGGFPGVPLSIIRPDLKIDMIDGTGKKIMVVQEAIQHFDLSNATAQKIRAEETKKKYEFVLARGVTSMEKLKPMARNLLHHKNKNSFPNGLITLKGGDPKEEIKFLSKKDYYEIYPLKDLFEEAFFEEKYILYLQF